MIRLWLYGMYKRIAPRAKEAHLTQEKAFNAARTLAQNLANKIDNPEKAIEVIINDMEGNFRDKHSYKKDPRNIRG